MRHVGRYMSFCMTALLVDCWRTNSHVSIASLGVCIMLMVAVKIGWKDD